MENENSLHREMFLQDREHAQVEMREGRSQRVAFLGILFSATGMLGIATYFTRSSFQANVSFSPEEVIVLALLLLFPYIFMFIAALLSHSNQIVDQNKEFIRQGNKDKGFTGGQQDYMDTHKHERASGRHAHALCAIINLLQVLVIAMAALLVYPYSLFVVGFEIGAIVGTIRYLN